jgi:hypothetical protein
VWLCVSVFYRMQRFYEGKSLVYIKQFRWCHVFSTATTVLSTIDYVTFKFEILFGSKLKKVNRFRSNILRSHVFYEKGLMLSKSIHTWLSKFTLYFS